ncbi:unnamed protein product [Mucor hiemalis]
METNLQERYKTILAILRSSIASVILTLQIVFLFAGWEQELLLLNSNKATLAAQIQGALIVFQTPFAITVSLLTFIETWVKAPFNLAQIPLVLGLVAFTARVLLTGFKEDMERMGTITEDYEVLSIFLLMNAIMWLLLARVDTEAKFHELVTWPFKCKEFVTDKLCKRKGYEHIEKQNTKAELDQ